MEWNFTIINLLYFLSNKCSFGDFQKHKLQTQNFKTVVYV